MKLNPKGNSRGAFDKRIKEAADAYQVTPPAGAWASVEAGIGASGKMVQVPVDRGRWVAGRWAAVAAIFLLSIFSVPFDELNSDVRNSASLLSPSELAKNLAQTEAALTKLADPNFLDFGGTEKVGLIIGDSERRMKRRSNSANRSIRKEIRKEIRNSRAIAADNRAANEIITDGYLASLAPLSMLNVSSIAQEEIPANVDSDHQDEFIPPALKPNQLKGVYIGVNTGAGLSWLQMKELSSINHFGTAINTSAGLRNFSGIQIGYNFSNKVAIETGVRYSKTKVDYSGGHYESPIEGSIFASRIEVPLLIKYKHSSYARRLNKPVSLNLMAGLQYSKFASKRVTGLESPKFTADDLFSNHELGISAGIEYDIHMSDRFFVSLGSQVDITGPSASFPLFNANETDQPFQLNASIYAGIHFSSFRN